MNLVVESWPEADDEQSSVFASLKIQYASAMMQMIARIESLNQQLALSCARNPIHHIEKRMIMTAF